jgi:uroporphyrinogen-III synthase
MNTPLAQKAVVVTRALHQADELNQVLRERGAQVLAYPCIAIAPPADPAPLHQAASDVLDGAFDWVIFTSSNSVRAVADVLFDKRTRHASSLQTSVKIAVVGHATAQAVKDALGMSTDLIPSENHATQIANELSTVLRRGARVLLPQSEIADPTLSERLLAMGVAVTTVNAYRTVLGRGGDDVPSLLRRGRVDAVTFTSPSTVENFLQRLQAEGGYITDLDKVCLAAIGQTTAQAIESCGLTVRAIASTPTVTSLADELEQYFAVERI